VSISTPKKAYEVGETIPIYAHAPNASYYVYSIYKDGQWRETITTEHNSIPIAYYETGNFSAYCGAGNDISYVEVGENDWINFSVYNSVPTPISIRTDKYLRGGKRYNTLCFHRL
jgi:hypothetical protein